MGSELRTDVQALRGIAVLMVLAHHAKVPLIRGGYLGVDIFFVLSGFLITALVAKDINASEFSFARFYWRRAWRLLPAVYATIALCIAAAPWLRTSYEMRDFVAQVWGAITFSANIVLWLQTGYFERAAELKPLLHVWSLSIEEQYYLLLPALLFFVGRAKWLRVASVVTAASLTACFFVSTESVAAAFYWVPTRAAFAETCFRTLCSDSFLTLPRCVRISPSAFLYHIGVLRTSLRQYCEACIKCRLRAAVSNGIAVCGCDRPT